MIRPVWIAVAFAAGIAVGVLWSRSGAPAAAPPIAALETAQVRPAAAHSVVPAIDPLATPVVFAPVPMTSTALPAEEAVEYTGYSEPIDVGPVLRKSLETLPVPGADNQLGDAHRALEREPRDDSWSYPLEAELQNSLLADVSAGRFTVEHLECRATACEVRLSGNVHQFEAVSRWADSPNAHPWGQRLWLTTSTTIGEGDRVDRLIILKKPPLPPKPPNPN